jgi:uncharacterized protein
LNNKITPYSEANNNNCQNNCFCYVIPAGTWQVAKPISDTVIAGCSVAPGFNFANFKLIDPNSNEAKQLITAIPEMAKFIKH